MGKRGPKPGHGGRPRGGKYPEHVRKVWREYQQERKAKEKHKQKISQIKHNM